MPEISQCERLAPNSSSCAIAISFETIPAVNLDHNFHRIANLNVSLINHSPDPSLPPGSMEATTSAG